jgi:hypothetical protein
MFRFSTKAIVFATALAASLLGILMAAFERNRLWILMPYAMYIGLLVGWCIYRDINEKP